MKPTKQNRSGRATASDNVITPPHIARFIVKTLNPSGICLEPCRGTGSIYNVLPNPKQWCEIKMGRDFFDFDGRVDWIITNPPYSIYNEFLEKSFNIADNVAFLVPIAKAFKSMRIEKMVDNYGGLKQIIMLGGGGACGFAFGFPVGILHYEKNYKGPIYRQVLTELVKQEGSK